MNQSVIFIPLLMHLFLVFWLYILLGIKKSKAANAGSVDRAAAALNCKAWPESVVKISNNIDNQFQTPVIFYTLISTFFVLQQVNGYVLVLASLYVVSRYIHAAIHTTSNFVPHRLKAFLAGVLILLVLSIWLMIKLVVSG